MNGLRKNRPCDYSPLEDRRLLAVTATLTGTTLMIQGDAGANTVNVALSGAFVDVSGDVTGQYNAADVTLIQFYGGSGNDFFENTSDIDTLAAGHEGNDTLRSGGGNDRLFGGLGNDTLVSNGGDDRLIGHEGIDMLFGGDGNDALYGLDGDDELHGEAGDDNLSGGLGVDVIYGGDGADTAFGHLGNDSLFGGAGNDRLYGQDDNDLIQGDDGDDVIRGGTGNDTLNGNDGNDRMLGEQGNDRINGGNGNETVFAGDGNDTVFGGAGNDFLIGGSGDDNIQGEAGNDLIRGNNGNDMLDGGANADRIAGDAGDDFIDGGTASDIVFGDLGDDTIVAETNDRVTGGAGNDTLQFGGLTGDTAVFSGDYSDYLITMNGDNMLVVRDTVGADGLDIVTGAESFEFADGTRAAMAEVTQRIYVQAIVVSNDNGSDTATFFGNAAQEFEIKTHIDEVYLQAGIDVEWVDTRSTSNFFFNFGEGTGERPEEDLDIIIADGDSAGVGNSDPLIIDMYFVNRTPGFEEFDEDGANGLAFIGANGIAMFVGENNLNSVFDRQIVGNIAAHEIAHNLGLLHIEDIENLLNPIAFGGFELSEPQIESARASQFSQPLGTASGGGGGGSQPRVLLEAVSLDDIELPVC